MPKKNIQGVISKSKINDHFLAINGMGFFPVCNKENVILTESEKKCSKIDFTRNGNFKKKTIGFINGDNDILLGWQSEPPKHKFPEHYKELPPIIINHVCLNIDKESWVNGTKTLPPLKKISYPYCTPSQLKNEIAVASETRKQKFEESKRDFLEKTEKLKIIDLSSYKHGGNPTTYINFKLNLDPRGCVGCLSPNMPSYRFEYRDFLNEFQKQKLRESILNTTTAKSPIINDGDIITISYLGTADNYAFEGGTSASHNLTIGSGSFIPGFEEQLIGARLGELRNINVTFPSNYHAEKLAGKNASFAVTVLDFFDQTNLTNSDIEIEQSPIVKNGSLINISFLGTTNNYVFEGGSSESHKLKIGAHEFIPGFEEQLIGATLGDILNLNVTFPKNYHKENLAGKNANFKVKILDFVVPSLENSLFSIYTNQFDPHYVQPLQIIDSKGVARGIEAAFVKKNYMKGFHTWGIEIYVTKKSAHDVKFDNPLEKVLANGLLVFSENGYLYEKKGNLDEINVKWTNDAHNNIKLNFGDCKKDTYTGGITQFSRIGYTGKVESKAVAGSAINAIIHRNTIINDPRSINLDGHESNKHLKAYHIDKFGKLFIEYENSSFNAYNIPTNFIFYDPLTIDNGKVTGENHYIIFDQSAYDIKHTGDILFHHKENIKHHLINLTEAEYEKHYHYYDENVKLEKSNNSHDLTIDGDGFFAMRCENYPKKLIFLTKNFRIKDMNNLKDTNGCFLLGTNIQNLSHPKNIASHETHNYIQKNLDNFHYIKFERTFKPTTEINIGSLLLNGEEPTIYEILNPPKTKNKNKDKNTIKTEEKIVQFKEYNPNNITLDLTHGKIKPQFSNIAVLAEDENGIAHSVHFGLVKVRKDSAQKTQAWKVEIYLHKNHLDPSENIQIANGDLTFNEVGALTNFDFSIRQINITKSEKSPIITVNWGDLTGIPKDPKQAFQGVMLCTQNNQCANKLKKQPSANGFPHAMIKEITLDGSTIKAKYSDHEFTVFQIALAKPHDHEGLIKYFDLPGYITTEDSGDLEFFYPKTAGLGGVVHGYTTIPDTNSH